MFKIGTHSGPFHADDVFGVAIVKMTLLDTPVEIIRSRDPKVLDTCNLLLDVGGEYDPAKRRFDHHQGNLDHPDFPGTPVASAGLVWHQYGWVLTSKRSVSLIVYKNLIRSIDAYDTGKIDCKGHFTVANMIAGFNPEWNAEVQDFDAQFNVAVEMAMVILGNEIRRAEALVAAEDIAKTAITEANGATTVVTERYAPIINHLVDDAPNALFWVYPGPGGDCWMVQCVPPSKGSFQQRRPLKPEWAGLRDEELQAASGVEDAVFVHPGQFIGGAKSQRGAMLLALGSTPLCLGV